MKKIRNLFIAVLMLSSAFLFTSCDMLMEIVNEIFGDFSGYVDDTFSGPENKWLEMTVEYDDNIMKGNANLAFFYTEIAREGHTDNNTRLKLGYRIEPGLTVLCYGQFTPYSPSGAVEMAYFIKTIPLDNGAKKKWGVIYNMSSPLRKLEKIGQTSPDVGDKWIKGENYGDWQVVHPEDGTTLPEGAERVPNPLTNLMQGFYFTNDTPNIPNAIDWDSALGQISVKLPEDDE